MLYLSFLIYLYLLAALTLFVCFRSWLWIRTLRRAGALRKAAWFGSPLVVVLALVYLTVDFMLLPKSSTVGTWREINVYGSRSYYGASRWYWSLDVERDSSGRFCVDNEWTVLDRVTYVPPYACVSLLKPFDRGFWSLTHTKREFGPEFDAQLSQDERQEIREVVADYIIITGNDFFPDHAEGVRAGRTSYTVPRWSGVVRSAVAAGVALLGAGSLLWAPFWLARRKRALANHPRCIACGYPREGLVSARCPECGSGFLTPPSAPESARAT